MIGLGLTLIGLGMTGIGGLGAYYLLGRENYIVNHKRANAVLNRIENMLREMETTNEPEQHEAVMEEEPKEEKDIIIELESYLEKLDKQEVES